MLSRVPAGSAVCLRPGVYPEHITVHKRFGMNHVRRGIRLDIPSGRRIGLIGPNGSGKSTLTRVMMGMLSCEGTVRLDGLEPSVHGAELLRRIAYVPQIAPQLFAPVGEVLRAVCELRDLPGARIRDLAHGLGLDVEALAARPFRNLSGGIVFLLGLIGILGWHLIAGKRAADKA